MKRAVLRMGDSGRWTSKRELGAACGRLLQPDLAIEFDVDPQPGDLQRHVRRKGFRSRDLLALERFRDRLLDLALRVDAYHLQKLADAQVEGFLIHRALPGWTTSIDKGSVAIRRELSHALAASGSPPPALLACRLQLALARASP